MFRLGLAQIKNTFSYQTNLSSILASLELHSKHGVDLVSFPECATTGYNTRLLQVDIEGIQSIVSQTQDAAKHLGLCVALPTPWPRNDGKLLNSVLIINNEGDITHQFNKIGFQKGEDRIFVPGEPHKRYFDLKSFR